MALIEIDYLTVEQIKAMCAIIAVARDFSQGIYEEEQLERVIKQFDELEI